MGTTQAERVAVLDAIRAACAAEGGQVWIAYARPAGMPEDTYHAAICALYRAGAVKLARSEAASWESRASATYPGAGPAFHLVEVAA